MSDIFNSLQFDNIDSLDNGIYITGESVYDSPERDVEAIEIAGRSGDYLLDKGRWKNIEVTYHCGCFGDDQNDFANKIRNFRNQLASKRGYKRIVDSYNPAEYRMGTFTNSVEVDAVSMKRAGEFDVVFNCKPQRYLTSGETELTMSRNQTLTNPTMFDASPLLKVNGYGTVGFNGYSIELRNEEMGEYELLNYGFAQNGGAFTIPSEGYNSGDTLTLRGTTITAGIKLVSGATVSNVVITSGSATVRNATTKFYLDMTPSLTFTAGTTSTQSNTVEFTATISYNGATTTANGTISYNVRYFNSGAIELTVTKSGSQYLALETAYIGTSVWVDSSVSILGTPTYIDCELGEAYMIKNGEAISLNRYIDLGSDLPTLASGNNTITFSNTITSLKIVPRWWVI